MQILKYTNFKILNIFKVYLECIIRTNYSKKQDWFKAYLEYTSKLSSRLNFKYFHEVTNLSYIIQDYKMLSLYMAVIIVEDTYRM